MLLRRSAWNVRRCAALLIVVLLISLDASADDRTVGLRVVDADSGEALPARIYLEGAGSTPYYFSAAEDGATAIRYEKQHGRNRESVEYHTTISAHRCTASVPPGQFTLIVERGTSYFPHTEPLQVSDEDVELQIALKRWINPAARGWYSGDTHIHRTPAELRNVVLAEDLNVAFPLTNWVTIAGRLPAAGDKTLQEMIPDELVRVDEHHVIWPFNTEYEIFTVGDRRHTLGALFVLNHRSPIEQTVPPWKPVLEWSRANNRDVLFDMDKLDWPFAMVLPTITHDALYELANNHVWRTEFAFRTWNTAAPAYIQPPFGGSEGGERQWIDYTLGMYYTLLNCGLRLPPSAGTANGVHPVPAGFSRVYVHQPDGFDYEDWVAGLRAGRSFVTTGPMLFATADSRDPGYIFRRTSQADDANEIPLRIEVISETPLSFGELIVNGRPEKLLRVRNEHTPAGAYRSLLESSVAPQRSGWFALRFWEDRPKGRVRFAHTGPWYVELDDQPVKLQPYEKEYLIRRMQDEIQRSRGVLSEDAMAEYRRALQFYEALPVVDDAAEIERNARPVQDEAALQQWLDNMVLHHRFTPHEVRQATGLSLDQAREAVRRRRQQLPAATSNQKIRVLPYPGGRHPRRGFLDGAVDPQRETKASVFLPWEEGGYVVIDVPEAIFSNLGLIYLAHTHVPTVWTKQDLELPPLEWRTMGDSLLLERTLPNNMRFTSRVTPDGDSVAMEMSLTNGTKETLSGLRSQVCVMLKGAVGFNAQMKLPHLMREPFAAIRAANSDRWIITAWIPCNRAWTNPPVPCIHSDPIFPDCPPGETVHVRGRLWFYEGPDIEREIRRLGDEINRAGE